MVKNLTRQKVKVLRPDNGCEYTSREFKNYLVSKGIEHQLSIPGRLEQDEVAERMNRTLIERALRKILRSREKEHFYRQRCGL